MSEIPTAKIIEFPTEPLPDNVIDFEHYLGRKVIQGEISIEQAITMPEPPEAA